MNLFHVIDDAAVLLRSKGVYRQAEVYRRGEHLYGAFGSGFISLHKGGGTSRPDVSWLDTDAPYRADKPGQIVWTGG